MRTRSNIARMRRRGAAEHGLSQKINDALAAITRRKEAYLEHATYMRRLIDQGEALRMGRISQINVGGATYSQGRIEATIRGASGSSYQTRITIQPRQGHNCTCPDWRRRGSDVGPCKHVLALAHYWLDERMVPRMEDLHDALSRALNL